MNGFYCLVWHLVSLIILLARMYNIRVWQWKMFLHYNICALEERSRKSTWELEKEPVFVVMVVVVAVEKISWVWMNQSLEFLGRCVDLQSLSSLSPSSSHKCNEKINCFFFVLFCLETLDWNVTRGICGFYLS